MRNTKRTYRRNFEIYCGKNVQSQHGGEVRILDNGSIYFGYRRNDGENQ